MFTIYKYTSPSRRNYIGITKYPEVRKRQHESKEANFDDTTAFAHAIRKYGFAKLEYTVLEEVGTLEEACAREVHYIQFYDSVNSGYNICAGGNYTANYVYGERVIEDIVHVLRTTDKKIREIAAEFGVSQGYISVIKNGKKRNRHKVIRPNHQCQKGVVNKAAKLSDEQIKEIQEGISKGVSRRSLQHKFKVSKTLIQKIAVGEVWTHVLSDYTYSKKSTNGNAVLTVDVVATLKQDIKTGEMTRKELAEKYKISIQTVDQIKAGKTWKTV